MDELYSYFTAGADAILTNTYQASTEGYMQYLGLEYDQCIDLVKSTVKYAQIARKKYLKEFDSVFKPNMPWILASIGPYGAHLHDGSEYTGQYAKLVDKLTLQQWHKMRINACLEAGVDGLAIETIPCRVRILLTDDKLFLWAMIVIY